VSDSKPYVGGSNVAKRKQKSLFTFFPRGMQGSPLPLLSNIKLAGYNIICFYSVRPACKLASQLHNVGVVRHCLNRVAECLFLTKTDSSVIYLH
jgi:hypothetical protein